MTDVRGQRQRSPYRLPPPLIPKAVPDLQSFLTLHHLGMNLLLYMVLLAPQFSLAGDVSGMGKGKVALLTKC